MHDLKDMKGKGRVDLNEWLEGLKVSTLLLGIVAMFILAFNL